MIAYKYVIFDSRDNVLQMYRGQRTFFQDVTVSPANLVVGYYAFCFQGCVTLCYSSRYIVCVA